MPTTVKVPDAFESNSTKYSSIIEESLLTSSKLESLLDYDSPEKAETFSHPVPPITPRTDFAMRQSNHLVERICRDHGVEAPKFTFAKCLTGKEEEVIAVSGAKHLSVLRLAEYLHKRGQIERDYAASIQKLNRQLVQTGDTDERLGQLIVMGEKSAAGHMDWARKIGEERIVDELKALCGENEEQRKYVLSELKKFRGIWSKAVGAFEKVRKNRDKALKAADLAQLALDNALSRGNTSKSTIIRLRDDIQQKSDRARLAREEYNRAMAALTQRQNEIFKEQIPQCFEGFERMERSRIAAVRASLIGLAQIHLAVADVEIESGQRWLKSLVSLSIDDEIEFFVQCVEERSSGRRILEDEFDFEGDAEPETVREEIVRREPLQSQQQDTKLNESSHINSSLYSCNLSNSESDLLKLSNGIDEMSDSVVLKERLDKLEELQTKLKQQYEALQRMEQAYTVQVQQNGETSNEPTLAAVKMSMKGIYREIEDNSAIIEQIEEKLRSIKLPGANSNNNSNKTTERVNPMSSILEELNKLDQRRNTQNKVNLIPAEKKQPNPVEKKKSLSRSFDDILRSGNESLVEDAASPKATGLKLPGAQWTAAAITKSNEEIRSGSNEIEIRDQGDYFCAEEEEEESFNERKVMFKDQLRNNQSPRRNSFSQSSPRHNSLSQSSPRRKSLVQSTPNATAALVPQNNKELFRVQALYNFIGRKETDELDLRTVLKDVIKVIKDEMTLTAKNLKKTSSAITESGLVGMSPYAVELEIKSCVDKRLVSSFTSFACKAAELMGLTISRGPAPLQPKYDRWTVLSSPFVHKTARTQFERREHCHVVKFDGIRDEEVAGKFVWYLRRHVPNEVELEITMHERGRLD